MRGNWRLNYEGKSGSLWLNQLGRMTNNETVEEFYELDFWKHLNWAGSMRSWERLKKYDDSQKFEVLRSEIYALWNQIRTSFEDASLKLKELAHDIENPDRLTRYFLYCETGLRKTMDAWERIWEMIKLALKISTIKVEQKKKSLRIIKSINNDTYAILLIANEDYPSKYIKDLVGIYSQCHSSLNNFRNRATHDYSLETWYHNDMNILLQQWKKIDRQIYLDILKASWQNFYLNVINTTYAYLKEIEAS